MTFVCDFCSTEYSRGLQLSHAETCSEAVVTCIHASNGCQWEGKRRSLIPGHIASCPYEAIKGFLSLHESRLADLREENLGLRNKIDVLQGHLQNTTRDLQATKAALGPWYTQALARSTTDRSPRVQQRTTSSTPHISESTASPPAPSTSADTPDIFAPYFPEDETFSAQTSPEQLNNFSWRPPLHGTSPNISQTWDPSSLTSRPVVQNNVAPLDLSTTLEGSLSGLRQSVVSLSTSVDSFGRRNEIALTNEAFRVNEEIRSLRANIHGLRMQVCLSVNGLGRYDLTIFSGSCYYDGPQCSSDGPNAGSAVSRRTVDRLFSLYSRSTSRSVHHQVVVLNRIIFVQLYRFSVHITNLFHLALDYDNSV